MATEIGIIKAIIGTATATSSDGTIRNLQVGDKVYQNDLITTSAAAAIEIEFLDGTTMDMGRSSQAILDLDVFNPNTATTETAGVTEVTDDVAAIQQALLDGEDPTIAGEATAAGAGAGEGSEGGHDFVIREYLNPEVTPDNGFDTIGPTIAFENPEELNLIIEEDPIVEPPVNGPPSITPDPETPPEGGNGGPENIVALALVSEAGLEFGSDPESGSASYSGSFFISDPDGVDDIVSIAFNGSTPISLGELIPGLVIETELGEITIDNFDDTTGRIDFTYELKTNVLSDPALDDGNNIELNAEIISVVVTDTAGQQGSGNIVIDVVDDIPDAILNVDQEIKPVDVTIDETDPVDELTGVRSATGDFSVYFVTDDSVYGADGPGSVSYGFALNGEGDIGSGLFALDAADVSAEDGDGIGQGD
ncbi:retention module-containing protein, partial [Methylophaga sp. OBS3]|uniref:retention module-containing protein n=1 Tax=Methylophaga sp. OBS3 TaxID=2991934 RepID=UPI00224CF537